MDCIQTVKPELMTTIYYYIYYIKTSEQRPLILGHNVGRCTQFNCYSIKRAKKFYRIDPPLVFLFILEKCNSGCGSEFTPVCGSDNTTYNNECILRMAKCQTKDSNLEIQSNGTCKNQGTTSRVFFYNFNAVLIRLVAQVKISLLLKIQWREHDYLSERRCCSVWELWSRDHDDAESGYTHRARGEDVEIGIGWE